MLVRALGLKEYAEVWQLQRELVEKRREGEIPDTLILVEHLPVYTRGISSKAVVPCFLPYPLHSVERGGDLTYHGPGQLVGYPIIDLGERSLKIRSYLRTLEAVLIEALRPLDLEAEVLRGFTGVWCQGKKIASIGVAVKDSVSYHGFALNVSVDLEPFSHINPCNLEPDEIGSIQGLLGRPVHHHQVLKLVADAFLAWFAEPTRVP
ncbi:MAG: lipoyl(octanoyl) transferase LipB [Elusimicrobia bacterium]|nr:lipoyl(octanoyl) transferase LipB [Elusimicrobiota bacterium]